MTQTAKHRDMMTLRHLLSSFRTCLFLASASLMLLPAKNAVAERPWVDSQKPAYFLKDQIIHTAIEPLLTALPDGTLFTLDLKGIPQRLDPETGTLYPITSLPKLTTLNATTQGLWGVSVTPRKMLLNFSPDGRLLNHLSLDTVLLPQSHITAIEVSTHAVFLADEAMPALIMINLDTGHAERLLESSPSLMAHTPLYRNHQIVRTPSGQARSGGNIRFMVLSSHEDWLFYQAPSGPLYRLGTSVLTDPQMSPAQQIEAMAKWRETPSLGGLGITKNDTIYMIDIDHGDLLQFGADRLPWRRLHDMRLTQAYDLAILPQNSHAPLTIAVLTQGSHLSPQSSPQSSPNETHLLTYGVTENVAKSSH